MTYGQRIKSILSETEHNYIGDDNLHGDNEQGITIISYVLKLQIPRYPLLKGNEYADGVDGPLVWDTWQCPNCKANYKYDDSDLPNCCSVCGQRLDWQGV